MEASEERGNVVLHGGASKGSSRGLPYAGSRIVHGVLLFIQLGFAGHQVLSKVALTSGLSQFVFSIYRNCIALVIIAPIAYYLERKELPALSFNLLLKFFYLGLTGIVGSQQLFLAGLVYTSATFASTIQNAVPVITFIVATILGLEKVRIDRLDGKAKILGTVVCVSGAALMSIYRGPAVIEGWAAVAVHDEAQISSIVGRRLGAHLFRLGIQRWQIGGILLLLNCISWAGYLTMQAPILKEFPAPFTITVFTYLFGSIQVYIVMLAFGRGQASFALQWGPQLLCVLYAGVVSSGLNFSLQSWCIHKGGPLLVALYTPVQTVVVCVLSIIFLGDSLFLGSLLGGLGAVSGLYMVTWGQVEHRRKDQLEDEHARLDHHASTLIQPLLTENNFIETDLESLECLK